MEVGAEDLTVGRAQAADEDDDEHDDHDDSDKINDTEGVDPERLKAFNVRHTHTHTVLEKRSEERRVGKECLRLCRSRWSPYH